MDKIQILIDADRTALTQELQGAFQDVKKFLDEVNSQSVDWSMIFTRSIGPALVSGLAGAFALAITQAIELQQSLAQAGAQGSQSFSDSITGDAPAVTQSLINIGNASDQTAQAVAGAQAIASKYISDTATQLVVVQAAGQLAAMGFGSLNDETTMLSEAMQSWSINSVPAAEAAINGLWQASKNGSIGYNDLLTAITSSGSALSSSTTIGQASAAIEAMTDVAGQTKTTVLNAFSAIVTAAADPTSAAAGIFENWAGTSINNLIDTKGITGALDVIDKALDTGPKTSALAVGTAFGLTAGTVDAFRDSSIIDFQTIMDKEDKVIAKTATLQAAFGTFQETDPSAGFFSTIINDVDSFINAIKSFMTGISTKGGSISNIAGSTAPTASGLNLNSAYTTPNFGQLSFPQPNQGPSPQEGSGGIVNSGNNVTINFNSGSSSPSVLKNATSSLYDSSYGTQTKTKKAK